MDDIILQEPEVRGWDYIGPSWLRCYRASQQCRRDSQDVNLRRMNMEVRVFVYWIVLM